MGFKRPRVQISPPRPKSAVILYHGGLFVLLEKSNMVHYTYTAINYTVIMREKRHMALRDRSLDEKMITAARDEFSEKGYSGASLRKIAERAGATVGAIQTRYKSKNDLFGRLLKPLLDEIEALFQNTKAEYYSSTDGEFLTGLKASMQRESASILHLVFDHYDEAVLLLCRSTGSSFEHYFDGTVQCKIKERAAFFRAKGFDDVDERLLGLLISAQFDSYRRIVAECFDRRTAEKYMNSLMICHFGGWSAFFESANKSRKGM